MTQNEPFLFTVPTGETVEIEPFHYAVIGQTQFSGKTTLMKRLAKWVEVQGFKVLIFDTKETTEDYSDFGQEIPVVMKETTDSFVLIGLLESMFKRRLTPYYATLDRLSTGAKSMSEIICKAQELEQTSKSGFIKDAARSLYRLLERLEAETEKIRTVPKLELHEGINRMVINRFSLEAQQLIVKYAFDDALTVYRGKLVIMLDEAFKFIPQGYSSPATRSVMSVMTQGAKTGLFCWIGTQFLAITDKDPLKACAFKFLGTQDHPTEVKHTLDLVPEARGRFSGDDIMNLKLGHFILVRKRPRDVRTVYVAPVGLDADVARDVARGLISPEKVRDLLVAKDLFKENGEDELFKEKYEDLLRKYDDLQKELDSIKALSDPAITSKLQDDLKVVAETLEMRNRQMENLRKDSGDLQLNFEDLKRSYEKLSKFKITLAELFREALSDVAFPVNTIPVENVSMPSEISVNIEQPSLHIKVKKIEPLILSDKDLIGKIAILYSAGYFDEKEWFTVTDVNKGFEPHNWNIDPRTSKALDELTNMRFLTKKMAGKKPIYHFRLTRNGAEEAGLLKYEEV